jgi:hypothetical protein
VTLIGSRVRYAVSDSSSLAAKRGSDPHSSFIKMCNYALGQLSSFDIPGLPQLREDRHIVFACPRETHAGPPSCSSDAIMVTWDALKRERSADQNIPYSDSYESDICSRKTGLGRFRADTLLTVEMWKGSKKEPGVQCMINANRRLYSFDTTHTIDLVLIGTYECCKLTTRVDPSSR